jgi:hypothetical protein
MKQTMGWGEIAQSLGIKVSDVTRNEEAVQHAMNKAKENGKNTNQKEQSTSRSSNSNSKGSNFFRTWLIHYSTYF